MPRPLVIASSALLVILAGLVGCSSGSGQPGPPTAPPSQAMITWVDSVCSADSDLRLRQGVVRNAALSTVPQQLTRQQVAGFIVGVRTSLSENLTTFQNIRTGVVNGGDRVVDAYVTAVRDVLAKLDEAEKRANDASSPDFALPYIPLEVSDIVAAAAPIGADLPGLVDADPTLHAAYQRATSCEDAKPLTTAGQTPAPTTSR